MFMPTIVVPPEKRQRFTDIELCAWIGQAVPGEWLEYHRGFLGIDTATVMSTLPQEERRRLTSLAKAAHRAFEAGLVHLVQVRLGPDRFAYLAIARPRRNAASAALPALLVPDQEAA